MKKYYVLFILIVLAFGCTRHPSISQTKKKYIKKDKEIVEKLVPAPLPDEFLNKQVDDNYLKTGWYIITDSTDGIKRKIYREQGDNAFFVNTTVQIELKDIELFCLTPNYHNKEYVDLVMYFSAEGTRKWEILTEKSIGKQLAFIVNNILLTAPLVNGIISSGASALSGNNFTAEEMLALKIHLQQQKMNVN